LERTKSSVASPRREIASDAGARLSNSASAGAPGTASGRRKSAREAADATVRHIASLPVALQLPPAISRSAQCEPALSLALLGDGEVVAEPRGRGHSEGNVCRGRYRICATVDDPV
jgi:hypothetical protein